MGTDALASSEPPAAATTVGLLRAELEKKQQELQQLQDSFDEYTQSSQELESELEGELARLERQHAQAGQRVLALEEELQQTRTRLDKTQQEMRQCANEVASLREELTRVTTLKRKLEQEQDELTTQVRILTATADDLRYKMEREMEEKVFLVSDQEELRNEHELVTERLRTEILDLQSELFAVQQKNAVLVEQQQQQEEEQQLQQEEKERLEEFERLQQELERSIDMDVDVDYDEDGGQSPRLSTLQERDENDREQLIETLQRELDVLSVRLQEEMDARERLEAEFLEAQNNLAQAEAMETEMMEMSDELIEKSQEIRKRDVELEALQEVMTTLQTENAALQQANADLQHQQHQDAETKTQDSQQQYEEEIQMLRSECEEWQMAERALREKLEQAKQIHSELEARSESLEKQVAESAEMQAELEAQLGVQVKKKQQELEEFKDANSTLRQQLETASRKAADLERATLHSPAPSTVSSTTSATSSPATPPSGKRSPTKQERDSPEARRFLLEVQSLRANITSLQAENARLRSNETNDPSTAAPSRRVSTDLLTVNYSADQLAKKYLSERTRNAALLSRLQTVCGNIQVFCRVRPIVGSELEKCYTAKLAVNVINQSDVASLDVRPDQMIPTSADGNQPPDANTGSLADFADINASWKVFTFDRVIGPAETQIDVFREVEPIAQSVVEGFKACIFAYGQTGSGKTYTMEGSDADPGLNYRVVNHIFQSISLRGAIYDPDREETAVADNGGEDEIDSATASGELSYHIQVGVLEIYNESLRDLVDPANAKPLEIRQDTTTGDICVPDLTMATVSSPKQTIDLLRNAQTNRVTGKTDVNAYSSRSHCVVIIQISTRTPSGTTQNDSELLGSYVSGKLYMVDLAGSERVKKSNVSGAMLREAAHINKSLSALADVMEALDKKHAHVPYRNSKLTYLLQDVLHSSCKTVMIVNVGPTLESANETFRSLQLAERVRHVVVGRNSIVKNKKDLVSAKRAFAEIQTLKQQMQISERKVKQSQQTVVAMKREQKNHSDKASSALQSRVRAAELQLLTVRNQAEALRKINTDLTEQMKQAREAKQKEVDQREATQKQLRQLNSKTRVSSSHQESLERQLKDREEEIKKLRQLLTDARQRTTTSVIPRNKAAAASLTRRASLNGLSKKPDGDKENALGPEHDMSVDNQEDEKRENQKKVASTSVSAIRGTSSRFGYQRQSGTSSTSSNKLPSSSKSDVSGGSVSKFRRIGASAASSTSGSSSTRATWK